MNQGANCSSSPGPCHCYYYGKHFHHSPYSMKKNVLDKYEEKRYYSSKHLNLIAFLKILQVHIASEDMQGGLPERKGLALHWRAPGGPASKPQCLDTFIPSRSFLLLGVFLPEWFWMSFRNSPSPWSRKSLWLEARNGFYSQAWGGLFKDCVECSLLTHWPLQRARLEGCFLTEGRKKGTTLGES